MNRLSHALPLVFVGLFGCNALLANSEAETKAPSTDDTGKNGSDDTASTSAAKKSKIPGSDGGVPAVDPGFDVTAIVTGRSYLGARNAGGWHLWRDGIAVSADKIYWVEGGANAGLYETTHEPCTGTCGTLKVPLTRASSFAWSGTSMWVADGNAISRVEFGATTKVAIASAASEVVNLATDGTDAFWIAESGGNINRTSNGVTSTLSGSNGSPIALAVAAGLVYWLGVDISGASGLLQSVKTEGGGARGIKSLSGGPSLIGANRKYVYYALDERGEIRRFPTAGGNEELVVNDAESPASFAFDDTYAYWVEKGSATGSSNGTLRRVAHNDTTVVTMASSIPLPVGLAVSGDEVFVLSAGTKDAKFADGKILRVRPR